VRSTTSGEGCLGAVSRITSEDEDEEVSLLVITLGLPTSSYIELLVLFLCLILLLLLSGLSIRIGLPDVFWFCVLSCFTRGDVESTLIILADFQCGILIGLACQTRSTGLVDGDRKGPYLSFDRFWAVDICKTGDDVLGWFGAEAGITG
jgi:hypothetical protein